MTEIWTMDEADRERAKDMKTTVTSSIIGVNRFT